MVSPTGQLIVPSTCPGSQLVDFITNHLKEAKERSNTYSQYVYLRLNFPFSFANLTVHLLLKQDKARRARPAQESDGSLRTNDSNQRRFNYAGENGDMLGAASGSVQRQSPSTDLQDGPTYYSLLFNSIRRNHLRSLEPENRMIIFERI